MNTILRIWATLCLLLPISLHALTINSIYYTVDYNKNIATCVGADTPWTLTIPKEIPTPKGYNVPVVNIASEAFKNEKYLNSVNIESDLQKIGNSAFEGCISLTEIVFSGSVEQIEQSAFAGCEKLQNVVFLNHTSDTYIGDHAFENCDITTIQFGDKLRYIGKSAFANNNLTKLNLPNSLETIDDCAFFNAFRIVSNVAQTPTYKVSIPNSVTYIGSKAFDGCPLSYITIEDGESILTLEKDSFTDYPDFSERKYFSTDFYLGRNVNNENEPFRGADFLRTLHLGNLIKGIANNQFEGCPNLQKISFNQLNEEFHRIGNSAFKDCQNLSQLDFFNGKDYNLEEVGDSAFYNCFLNTSIDFSSSILKLGEFAFANNPKIRIINFREDRQIKRIPKHCFSQTSCDIFYIWESPDSLYIESLPSNVEELGIFSPIDKSGWYLINDILRRSVKYFRGGAFLKEIPNSVFNNFTYLVSVDLCHGLETIGDESFKDTPIRKLYIPSSVRAIGNEAFFNCNNLQLIHFGGTITGLHGIPLDDDERSENLQYIGDNCFMYCPNIQNIDCYNPLPPTISKKSFSQKTYENAILRVPFGANYPETPYWSDFIRVKEQLTAVDSITLNKNQITATLSEPFFLSATVHPEHVEYINNTSTYSWISEIIKSPKSKENLEFERQDANMMLVHPKYPGKYNVICSYSIDKYFDDPIERITVSDTCLVTVLPPKIKSIGLEIPTEIYVGGKDLTLDIKPELEESYPLYFAELLIENATPKNWVIDYDRINQTLKITPTEIGTGHCIIRDAATNEVLKDVKIEIKTLITSFGFQNDSVDVKTGEYVDLTYAHLKSAAGSDLIRITFKNLNNNVASYIKYPLDYSCVLRIYGYKPGSFSITAKSTDGTELSSQCVITVSDPTIVITSISIDQSNIFGNVGDTFQLNATIVPENASDKTLKWESENPSVAAVNNQGLIILKSAGTTTIKASATDGSGITATCKVTVNDSNGVCNVEVDSDDEVKIYNIQGILLYDGIYSEANLPAGIYILNINGNYMKRWINMP